MMLLDKLKYILVFTVLVMVSCNDEEDLPDEPVINSVDYIEEERDLQFTFTDGDGNFGLPPSDTLPPFQPLEDEVNNIPNEFHNNLWLDIYVLRSGTYELIETPNPFDFRIPLLTPTGQNKQLRVTTTYDLSFDFQDLLVSGDYFDLGDTLRFDVTIVDRDLNVSNVATTEGHILQ